MTIQYASKSLLTVVQPALAEQRDSFKRFLQNAHRVCCDQSVSAHFKLWMRIRFCARNLQNSEKPTDKKVTSTLCSHLFTPNPNVLDCLIDVTLESRIMESRDPEGCNRIFRK